MNNEKILDISWGTILKIALAVIFFYILYQVRDILILFIFALIISILFTPIIDFLNRIKVPRVLAVILVYLGFFITTSLLVYFIIPLFINEIQSFVRVLPHYFDQIAPPLRGLGIEALRGFEDFIMVLGRTLEEMAATIFGAVFVLFGGIFAAIFVLTIAIFISLEERGIEKTLSLLFPKKYEGYVLSLWTKCQNKVNAWFFSRILGSLFVGVLSYAVLLFFEVRYSFSLGLLTGILNFVPTIGPIIATMIIFVIIALTNMMQAIFVVVIFTLIQQIENNIILPILTRKFIGLSPVLVLLALAIGGVLWGFLGAILAVPLLGILFEFFKEFLQKRREEEAVML